MKTAFLTDIEVFEKSSQKSEYIGVTNVWKSRGIIKADVQISENSEKENPYGETENEILNIYYNKSFIQAVKGNRILFNGRLYEIISSVPYRMHIKVVAKFCDYNKN